MNKIKFLEFLLALHISKGIWPLCTTHIATDPAGPCQTRGGGFTGVNVSLNYFRESSRFLLDTWGLLISSSSYDTVIKYMQVLWSGCAARISFSNDR